MAGLVERSFIVTADCHRLRSQLEVFEETAEQDMNGEEAKALSTIGARELGVFREKTVTKRPF